MNCTRFANGYRINYINQTREYNYFNFTCTNQASDVWNLAVNSGLNSLPAHTLIYLIIFTMQFNKKYNLISIFVIFGIQIFISFLQLVIPREVSTFDSSGLSILQPVYISIILLNFILIPILGLYFLFNRNSCRNIFKYLVSVFLIITPLIFYYLFFEFRKVLYFIFGQNYDNLLKLGVIKVWQDSVFICLIFSILQFILVLFYQKKLMKKLIK